MNKSWLADSIARSLSGPMWHGSAVDELLQDVDHEAAAQKTIPSVHSIWELVLHMTVWTDVARRRGEGQQVLPKSNEDWPAPNDLSAREWERDRARLRDAHEKLAGFASELSDTQLDAPVAGHEYSLRTMLHGVVEHDCYHGGQIALLRKLVGEESR